MPCVRCGLDHHPDSPCPKCYYCNGSGQNYHRVTACPLKQQMAASLGCKPKSYSQQKRKMQRDVRRPKRLIQKGIQIIEKKEQVKFDKDVIDNVYEAYDTFVGPQKNEKKDPPPPPSAGAACA